MSCYVVIVNIHVKIGLYWFIEAAASCYLSHIQEQPVLQTLILGWTWLQSWAKIQWKPEAELLLLSWPVPHLLCCKMPLWRHLATSHNTNISWSLNMITKQFMCSHHNINFVSLGQSSLEILLFLIFSFHGWGCSDGPKDGHVSVSHSGHRLVSTPVPAASPATACCQTFPLFLPELAWDWLTWGHWPQGGLINGHSASQPTPSLMLHFKTFQLDCCYVSRMLSCGELIVEWSPEATALLCGGGRGRTGW